MRASELTISGSYAEVVDQYTAALGDYGVAASMLTHKWQHIDLIYPHSDLDVRIVLNAPPSDWTAWNERLAAAHTATVATSPTNRRLLEHPPGFAFTAAEIEADKVAPAEMVTWDLIDGHAETLQLWRSRAKAAPWSTQDARFYRGILNSRLHGRYRLGADSTDNIISDLPGYRRHCVAWHYVAPCWFAAASLATRTRSSSKTAALNQWRPGELKRWAELFLNQASPNARTRPRPDVVRLLSAAHATLDVVARHIPDDVSTVVANATESPVSAWTMAAGMLRVRRARWLYYLNPPVDVATNYLINREAKELRAIAAILRGLAAETAMADHRLAGQMAALIPTGPITPTVLNHTLTTWDQRKPVVEDFLTSAGV